MPLTVAILSTGRVNPAISPAFANLLLRYHDLSPETTLICFENGFRGILLGQWFKITPAHVDAARLLLTKGGSPIGSSRVRLSNTEHLARVGLLDGPGADPIAIAARRLDAAGVDVLHVIGSTHALHTAESIAQACNRINGGKRVVRAISIPKTIENDIWPVACSLGAESGAMSGALFFSNVVNEFSASPRSLVIHEIKGRNSGHLAAATAREYRRLLTQAEWSTDADATLNVSRDSRDIHGIYIPELAVNWASEVSRLRRVMDRAGNVNLFVSQGAFAAEISADPDVKQKRHELGYVLTEPAEWLKTRLGPALRAQKVLVQKSGIYVRGAAGSAEDRILAQNIAATAVDEALRGGGGGSGGGGVVGHDREQGGRMRLIEIERVREDKGGFDCNTPWFRSMLRAIGQPLNLPPGKEQTARARMSKL